MNQTLEAIIKAYRSWIKERYSFENLSENYEVPSSITEEKLEELRAYFLDYIYPDIRKRKQLNEAFESLDGYIQQPKKLFKLLATSARLLFRYGKDLPKILNAAIKAMRSFRSANHFERELVKAAEGADEKPPFNIDNLKSFISTLSKSEIDTFIENTQSLFEILNDRKLVSQIRELVTELIQRMKKSDLFSDNDVSGLALGLEMIEKGDDLFKSLVPKDQDYIFEIVVQIERDVIDDIFKNEIT